MPTKSKKVSRTNRVSGTKLANKARRIAGKMKKMRITQTGVTSRVRGHVSARGKRAQARRDSR